jgi:hypothetical protein
LERSPEIKKGRQKQTIKRSLASPRSWPAASIVQGGIPTRRIRDRLVELGIAFYYFLLFSTVFDVVCDWKPLATAGMKSRSNPKQSNGLHG